MPTILENHLFNFITMDNLPCYNIFSYFQMPPLYSGTADEWSYVSNDTSTSHVKSADFIIDNFDDEMKKGFHKIRAHPFIVKNTLWRIEVEVMKKDKDGKNYIAVFLRNDNDVNLEG